MTKKIMLVEDDNNLREIYGARLMAEGFEIVSVQDGEEALAQVVKEKPDLIISDVMMPKISGFDMLDILRSTPETKNTKVVMMTALSQAEDKDRADQLGADRYLVKSQVTLEDVARVVHELLDDNYQQVNDGVPSEANAGIGPAAAVTAAVPVGSALKSADTDAAEPPAEPKAPEPPKPKTPEVPDAPAPSSDLDSLPGVQLSPAPATPAPTPAPAPTPEPSTAPSQTIATQDLQSQSQSQAQTTTDEADEVQKQIDQTIANDLSTPTVQTPPPAPAADDDSADAAEPKKPRKVIKPMDTPEEKKKDINELYAEEMAKEDAPSAEPVIEAPADAPPAEVAVADEAPAASAAPKAPAEPDKYTLPSENTDKPEIDPKDIAL